MHGLSFRGNAIASAWTIVLNPALRPHLVHLRKWMVPGKMPYVQYIVLHMKIQTHLSESEML